MTRIVLLGTSHTLQCGHASIDAAGVNAFEAEVKSLITMHAIVRIAEEMSRDGLARHNVTSTISERVAQSAGIEHHYVDLEQEERTSLGIHDGPLFTIQQIYRPPDSGKAFREAMSVLEGEVRERIWVYRILGRKSTPVLFVCGASHVVPLARMWHLLGMECEVAHYDYAVTHVSRDK